MTLGDVVAYLCLTQSELEIDFIIIDSWVHVMSVTSFVHQQQPTTATLGPRSSRKITTKLLQANVNDNTDPSFLTCCDGGLQGEIVVN